jgi:hypothetical protein
MKFSVSAVVLLCAGLASASVVAPIASVSTQFHAQDELGQYSYGYSGGPSAKTETKTADGVVRGGYSYVDGHGLVQSASYVADPHNGFRVAATNLPVAPAAPAPAPVPLPVAPVPVVKAAPIIPAAPVLPAVAPLPVYKAATYAPLAPYAATPYAAAPYAHYAAPAPVVYAASWPAGVETPDVTLAKAAHIQAVHDQKALIHSWRRKRSAPLAYAAYPGYAYSVPKGFAYSSVTHGYTPAHYPYAAPYAYTPAATYPLAAAPLAHAPLAHAPLPVGDTPEVAAAKAAHFAAVHEAKARVYAAPHAPAYHAYAAPHVYASHAAPLPLPVTDTPEVAHAKAAHLAAVSAAKYSAYHH